MKCEHPFTRNLRISEPAWLQITGCRLNAGTGSSPERAYAARQKLREKDEAAYLQFPLPDQRLLNIFFNQRENQINQGRGKESRILRPMTASKGKKKKRKGISS